LCAVKHFLKLNVFVNYYGSNKKPLAVKAARGFLIYVDVHRIAPAGS
jgi:hypothetical protein